VHTAHTEYETPICTNLSTGCNFELNRPQTGQ
jgi:hypothetical protein